MMLIMTLIYGQPSPLRIGTSFHKMFSDMIKQVIYLKFYKFN